MNLNPFDQSMNDKDSKKLTFNNYKVLAHEGLMPVSVKMITNCIAEKVKKIDGVELTKVILVGKLESIDPKTNKVILKINDTTDSLKIVTGVSS